MSKPAKFLFSAAITSFALLWSYTASSVLAANAVLKFSPSSGTITEGESLEVEVLVDTDGAEVGAVDVLASFDSSKLEVSASDSGSVFDIVSISGDLGSGDLDVSAFMASGDSSVSGSDQRVVVLTVTARDSSGTVPIVFGFTPGSTSDCNVIEKESIGDILASVGDGSYTLAGAGSEDPTSTPTATTAPDATATPTTASGSTSTPTPTTASGSGATGSTSTPTPTTSSSSSTATPTTSGGTGAVAETPTTGDPITSVIIAFLGITLLFVGVLLAF